MVYIQFPDVPSRKNHFLFDKGRLRIIFRSMSKSLNKNINKLAEMFKALSNPNRLKIFMRLLSCCQPGIYTSVDDFCSSKGCACVGDLGKDLGIAASTISHHIKELRRAGLIHMERRGQKIECRIESEALAGLKNFFP